MLVRHHVTVSAAVPRLRAAGDRRVRDPIEQRRQRIGRRKALKTGMQRMCTRAGRAYMRAMRNAARSSVPSDSSPFPSSGHDHGHCIVTALNRATALCEREGVRLTPLRRRVLELVWESHAPIGAYQIMEKMRGERGAIAPPTVYRALDFLAENGLVHRLDTLNAFIGCPHPGTGHKAYFLICRACRDVVEFADAGLDAAVADRAGRAGFSLETETIELTGLCARCAARPAADLKAAVPADETVTE